MLVIHKFVLPIAGEVCIDMPWSARMLHVDGQGWQLCVWALVDPEQPKMQRRFAIIGTGNSLPSDVATPLVYIGTAVMFNELVWHVFDRGEFVPKERP